MQSAADLAWSSLMISLGIVLIAAFLGLRQWYEQQAREPDLSDLDRAYFTRQDLRRGWGVAVMLILAAGLSIGTRIAPRVDGHGNLTFVVFWMGEIGLLAVLIVLAGIDWFATRRYALRHRRSMARERVKMLRDAIRDSAKSQPEPDGEAEQGGE
jgi:hypothetical protein